MRIIKNEREYSGPGVVLALGMFDGVHIGHRALISRAVQLAGEMGLESMVCTFDRHPRSVLFPEKAPEPLMNGEEQLRAFEELGADWALIKRFDMEFADVAADVYIASLVSSTKARCIVCGMNYSFGKGGAGNPDMLRELSGAFDYRVEIVDAVKDEGEMVSSTLIRTLIKNGDLARADRLLGRTRD